MSNPQSIMMVIEVLGYGFMGVATLCAAGRFGQGGIEQAIRWLFVLNGVLGIGGTIGYALELSMRVLYGGLILWDAVMPATAILLAVHFRKLRGQPPDFAVGR